MNNQNMLIIVQSNDMNSSRMFKIPTLQAAIDILLKIFIEQKFMQNNRQNFIVDLQEMINFYQHFQDIIYLDSCKAQTEEQSNYYGQSGQILKTYKKIDIMNAIVDCLSQKIENQENQEITQSFQELIVSK